MARRDAGSGSITKMNNGKWLARLELPPDPLTGKRRRASRWADTKAGAQRKLAQMLRDRDAAGNLATGSITVEKYLTDWLTLQEDRLKPSTWRGYRSKIVQHVLPVIGRKRLDRLTPADIERVELRFADLELAKSSALQTFSILSRALKDAERKGLLTRNPCAVADRPHSPPVRRDEIPPADLARFIEANQDDPYIARVLLALATSGRQGEILGLELDRLHLEQGWVALTRSLSRVTYRHGCGGVCGRRFGGDCPHRRIRVPSSAYAEQVHGGLWLLEPKSVTSKRPMPLQGGVLAVLRAYVEQAQPRRFVFELDGQPIDPKRDWDKWRAMLEHAGLPMYTLHQLRHSTATMLKRGGVSDSDRQAVMGHSSIDMTDHYTHADAERLAAAARALDSGLQGLLAASQQA